MRVSADLLPRALYRAEGVRALDARAIEGAGIPGAELMERAGRAAWEVLRESWPGARHIGLLCGTGNNGGDGFVLARLAREAGLAVDLRLLGEPGAVRGDARGAWERMAAAGVAPGAGGPEGLAQADVVVDALFGTGLSRPIEGARAAALAALNDCARPLLAIDIPSGLQADTGAVLGAAARAAVTVSFIGLKQGMFTGSGRAHCGRIVFDDLDVPADVYDATPPAALRLTLPGFRALLAPRSRAAHKGHFGHVLVIGGESGFSGAARLAAEAAARVGAGLVSVATRAAHAAVACSARPELMCHGTESAADLGPLVERATVIAVGPGLGRSGWSRTMLEAALAAGRPLVLDADALNLVAEGGTPALPPGSVLTPHPGEAARLLGCSAAEVQADRFAAVRALQQRWAGVAVLKGSGTLVCAAEPPVGVCDAGNPGMASGGMGDVLSGVIAGLAAQGLDAAQAARLGVCLHAAAADLAAGDGERGMLAGDLLPGLRALANPSP